MRLKRLRIVDLPAAELPDLHPDSDGAITWDFENGEPMFIARTVGDWGWIWIYHMATYRFPLKAPPEGVDCVAVPHPGVEAATIIDGYYRMVLPVVLQLYGLESMHGTAVVPPGGGGVYTLHAYSKTGKSTLTLALEQRGLRVVADDALILDPEGVGLSPARPALRPIPFTMRLRSASAKLFGLPVRDKIPDPGELGEDDLSPPLPLAGFVLIERVDDGATNLARLAPHVGFKRLLNHCYTFDAFKMERTGAMMKSYLRFAREVPVAVFRYPSGLEKLPAVADELASHLTTGFADLPFAEAPEETSEEAASGSMP